MDPCMASRNIPVGIVSINQLYKNIFQLKRELVVSCCGELIALHTEIANLIVDVASVIDTETQVRISRLRYCTVQ